MPRRPARSSDVYRVPFDFDDATFESIEKVGFRARPRLRLSFLFRFKSLACAARLSPAFECYSRIT